MFGRVWMAADVDGLSENDHQGVDWECIHIFPGKCHMRLSFFAYAPAFAKAIKTEMITVVGHPSE